MKFRKMSFILCIMMFLFSGLAAYAAECELGIALGEKGAGVELAIYKVAEIKDGEYVWLSDYEGIKVDLDKVSSAEETKEAAQKLYSWSTEKNVEAQLAGVTDEKGSISFEVNTGVYVIAKQSEKGSMAPVLFMVSEEQTEEYLILSPKFSVQDDKDDTDDKDDKDDIDDKDDADDKDDSDDKDGADDKDDSDDKNDADDKDNTGEENKKDSDTSDKKAGAKTGDASKVVLWVAVLVAALAGAAVLNKKNTRKK